MSDLNEYEYENFDEEIRPPDNTIRERLIDYGIDNYNYFDNNQDVELQLAINESIREQEEYEKKIEKIKYRTQLFKDVLLKIKKISMLDKQILKLYDIIEPIINSYCICKIDIYECDKDMYDIIFSTLKKIRLTESEYILFNNLFII